MSNLGFSYVKKFINIGFIHFFQRDGIDILLYFKLPFIFRVAFSIHTEINEPASDQ